MKKKRILFFAIIIGTLLFSGSLLAFLVFFESGFLHLFVSSEGIIIYSPENITYNFSKGVNYTLNLSVGSFLSINNWSYTLIDLRHNNTVYDNVSFTPNITFNAVRWSNELIVFGIDNESNIYNNSVVFFVFVNNSAPIIEDLNNNIYVCENERLNYLFNTSDVDEDALSYDMIPKNPFYIDFFDKLNFTLYRYNIFSDYLEKKDVGVHLENISVSDGQYSDNKNLNITVIEVNNAPVIDNIGVQTVWIRGENSRFYYQAMVNDTEDGNSSSGNINFSLNFSGTYLFNISNIGIMNFSPNESYLGVHNITLCAEDRGISPHPNISLCGQDGGPITSCINFSLTVTDQNRPPRIINFYPNSSNLNSSGTDVLFFNITYYDPDFTIPDAYWYVNGIFKKYESGESISNFSYSFGCGISGKHNISVDITDGELNDSKIWNVSITNVECSPPGPGGGGGGGGGGSGACIPKWACKDWRQCMNLKKEVDSGNYGYGFYSDIKKNCSLFKLEEDKCGFQIRECIDINHCNTTNSKPVILRYCEYSENPTCFDGIKNCHNGSCEVLIDCGGPCAACPSCSDKIQNQGEERIDCGGPCSPCEEIPRMSLMNTIIIIILIIIFIIFIVMVILLLQRSIKKQKELKGILEKEMKI